MLQEQSPAQPQEPSLEPSALHSSGLPGPSKSTVDMKIESDGKPRSTVETQCQAILEATDAILTLIQSRISRDIRTDSNQMPHRGQCAVAYSESKTEWEREFYSHMGYTFAPNAHVDALSVRQACNAVEVDLDCCLRQAANHYNIPLGTLEAVVCGRFIVRRAGVPPCAVDLLPPKNSRPKKDSNLEAK